MQDQHQFFSTYRFVKILPLEEKFQIPDEKIWVVPNGVTLPDNHIDLDDNDKKNMEKLKDSKVVVFLGKTSVAPNAVAIGNIEKEILPKVRAKNKNVVFVIVVLYVDVYC